MSVSTRPDSPDRFLVWPALATTMAWPFAVFLSHIPGRLGSWVFLLSVLLFLVLLLISAILSLSRAISRKWRKSVSFAAIPILPLVFMYLFQGQVLFICDFMHLVMEQPAYDDQIAGVSAPSGSRFAEFDWSYGYIGDPEFRKLIYDETDKIALPAAAHAVRTDGPENMEPPPAPAISSDDEDDGDISPYPSETKIMNIDRETALASECAGHVRHIYGHYYVCDR